MRSFAIRALAATAALVTATASLAEANVLRAAKQYGIGYLQLMVMEDQKLVEKQAKAAGLGDVLQTLLDPRQRVRSGR